MTVVIDTNVLVAGLRSSLGASHRLLGMIGDGELDIAISVPLFLEYESVLKRPAMRKALRLTGGDIDAVLAIVAARARHVPLHFLWRPQLRDPQDEMVLETAVNAEATAIITFNVRDFHPAAATFGLAVLTPADHLPRSTP